MNFFRFNHLRTRFTTSYPRQRRKPSLIHDRLMLQELEPRVLMTSGLVAAYNFAQGAGSVLNDVSGNSNNGTLSDATWVKSYSTTVPFASALWVNGASNSMASIPGSSSLNLTKGMTLEAWVNPSSLNSNQGLAAVISKDYLNSTNATGYSLYAANGNGTPPAADILKGNTDSVVQAPSQLPLNTWTFLATTYDGSTLRMYVNGSLVGSKHLSGSIGTSSGALHFGGNGLGQMFTGEIGNVRIYNTALSQSAIQTDMYKPILSPTDTAPTVTSVTLANNTNGLITNPTVTVQFSKALDPDTITSKTIQLFNSLGSAVAASISYNSSNYTATLTPSTPLSNSSTYTLLVRGGTNGYVILDAAGTPLATTFSSLLTNSTPLTANAGPTESSEEGTAVQFAGSASGGTVSLNYLWNFGDGSTATGTLTPSHTYANAGSYTVSLTVTDSTKDSITSTTTATIADVPPTANSGGPYGGVAGSAINFIGSGSDPDPSDTLGYLWNFGDGSTSTLQDPSHTYNADGTYTVTFRVTASDGAQTTATTTATVGAATTTIQEPLLYQPNIQYVGAFRLPAVPDTFTPGAYTYNYGGTALTYNPADNGLFLVGQPYDQAISEISIPKSIVNSTNLSDLTTATVLQQPVQVIPNLPYNPPIPGNSGGLDIGGLLVDNGTLVGTTYAFFDANGQAIYSHFTLNSLNLSTASVSGLYQVGNLGAGVVAGYMTPIPTEWQPVLGDPYLTGQDDLTIISRTSSGPAAFGFDPSTLNYSTAAADTPYVYYPSTNPLGGMYEGQGPANPLENDSTTVGGVVFVPGTSSVLYFGNTATNYNGYGAPGDYGDTVDTAKGAHSLNGQYAFQVWAYNANDFVAAKQGLIQPWQVMPYDVWNFSLPDISAPGDKNAGIRVGGVAFDASTGRIYVSVMNADTAAPYSSLPLIEVFQVAMTPPSASGPAAPQVGTMAVTTTQWAASGNPAPGPIPSGTPVLLTAGNVYPVDLGVSTLDPSLTITQVAFYLESSGTGVPNPSSDELLGYGTPSTIPNASHNWAMTMSTAGLTSGTYTVYARALDSNGLWSAPVTATLTIA